MSLHLKNLYLFLIFLLWVEINTLNIFNNNAKSNVKNILVVIFPGGKYKNIQLRELFDYSIEKDNYTVYNFKYDIIIHQSERKIWELNNDNNEYEFFSFGNENYIEIVDIDDMPKKPQFKFYQIKLRRYYQDFLDSEIIEKVKERKYDLIITDRPNYIADFMQKRHKIELKMYLSQRPIPQLFSQGFDLNPSYFPVIGSDFSNEMTYSQRCTNFFYFINEKIISFLSRYEIAYLFNDYGYREINTNYYFKDAIVLIQYPYGIIFPLSLPPNIKLLNSFNLPIKNNKYYLQEQIVFFINKYEHIVIISKDIMYHLGVEIIESFALENNSANKVYGFILLSSEVLLSFEKENSPKNIIVLKVDKEDQGKYDIILNELLLNKKIVTLISVANIREISVSLSNSKPVISVGDGIYHHNINSYIRKNLLGIVINQMNNITEYNNAIRMVTDDEDDTPDEYNIYRKTAIKVSKILKMNKNAKEEFVYWLSYGFNHNFKHLRATIYDKSYFIISGMDVFIAIAIILGLLFLFIIYICIKVYRKCCNKRSKSEEKGKTKVKME